MIDLTNKLNSANFTAYKLAYNGINKFNFIPTSIKFLTHLDYLTKWVPDRSPSINLFYKHENKHVKFSNEFRLND